MGGVSLSLLGNCLVEEELAQTVISFNFGEVTPILFDCNAEQRERYFLPVLNRQKAAYLALMEPGKGIDLYHMKMRAVKRNGHYILNGEKVSLSRPGKDYFAVVFAATQEEDKRKVTCFLVDKDTPGFFVRGSVAKTGWRTQVREPVSLVFKHCSVPAKNILGEEGKAFLLGKKWLPSRRIIRGARCIGVAQRLLEEATTQTQSSQSFGQSISKRTSIQAALADIAIAIHACKLMVYEASWKADKGESIRRESAMINLFATEMLRNVADRIAHVFNGPPYIAGLPMEMLCRHALATSATKLALESQRAIITRDILQGLRI
ncbi:acyl-CoA dehydrogenase family protein [Chloroflexota bacterium]